MAGISLGQKNYLEKQLPDIRKRVSALPEEARFRSFGMVYAQVLWLRDKFGEIAIELYRMENQEALPIDETTENKDRL